MAELGFGLMRLPLEDGAYDTVDVEATRRMVDRFLDAGMSYFDTAYYYHDGASERAVGSELAARHPRGSFRLADKLPMKLIRDETDPSVQGRLLEEQMGRCGVDRFDSYMLHNVCRTFHPAAERLDSFGFLRDIRDAGLAGRVGFSVHDDADFVAGLLDRNPDMDFVQLQINYLDWDSDLIQSRRCYEEAVSRGIPVVVMEPVKGGALADPPEEARRVLERVDPEASMASWALRFVAGLDGVETVLSGMTSMDQLEDNISTFRGMRPLDGEESEALERVVGIISRHTAVPCTGCRYCVPACPKGILIPDYLHIYNSVMRAPAKGLQPQRFYYLNRSKGHGRASDCIGCGRCEADCPQHIEIRRELAEAASLLERM